MNFYLGINTLKKSPKISHPELGRSENQNIMLIITCTLICAYNALVLPHFDYFCEVWDSIYKFDTS